MKCKILNNYVVQSLSHVWLFATPWTAALQASLSITVSWNALGLMSTESVMLSNHLILCPLLLLPSIFPSIRVFSTEPVFYIIWPKYSTFNFSISPSKQYSGLISFRIEWLDVLDVQGTLKSLLQHHSWKASILWCSNFFMVQLSHPYMTTGKTIALTRWAFVSKVMSLLFNMLPRFVNQDLKRGSNRVSEETYLCLIVEEKSNSRYRILGIPNTFPCPCYTHIHRGPSFCKYREMKNHSFNSYSLNIFLLLLSVCSVRSSSLQSRGL